MPRSLAATLRSGLGIVALMLLTAVITLWVGSALLGSVEAWQQAFESAQPYLRLWRALLYSVLFALWLDLLRCHRDRPHTLPQLKRIGVMGLVLVTCAELTRL